MKRTSIFRRTRRNPARITTCIIGVCTVVLLSGCKDRSIKSYEVPKEIGAAITASHAGHAHADGAPDLAAANPDSPLRWQAPAHWKPKPAAEMRRASFGVPLGDGTEADLSVFVLGGNAGGLPANVNRWRTQLGLPEWSPDEIARTAETIPAGGVTFTLFDLAGKPDGAEVRMLAAVAEFQGQSWFVKLTGHDHCVAAEKPEFIAFLRSVKTL